MPIQGKRRAGHRPGAPFLHHRGSNWNSIGTAEDAENGVLLFNSRFLGVLGGYPVFRC
jgi:hypothetical protein